MKKLDRDLGLLSVISIACGAMVSGLLVLPGYAGKMTGPSVFLAFLVAGLMFLPATFSKAEMATALPEAGGDYLFVDRSMGPFFSTISGIGMYFTLLLKSAFALAGMGAYFLVLVPLPPVYARFFAVILGILLVVLNYCGAKKSGKVQTVLVVITGITLVVFSLRGSIEVHREYFKPFFTDHSFGFISAVAFVFVSYAGVTKVASVAEEVKDPGRIIPIGMLVSLGTMVFFYVVVVYITVGTVPVKELLVPLYKNAPLARVGQAIMGSTGQIVISIVSALALVAMANAGLMACSRYPFALGRNNQLPDFFSRIHSSFSTPSVSILVSGVLLSLSVLFLPVIQLAKLASAFKLLILAMLNVALIILRESEIEWYQPEFETPLYPYMQIFGAIACLFLIGFLGWMPVVSSMFLIAGGGCWYWFYVRERVDRQGAIFRTSADRKEKQFFQRVRSQRYEEKESVIVPFFGLKGTDMLHVERRIRVAAALCDRDEILEVVDFVEVPDQSFLSEFEADPENFEELEERVELLENEIPNEIHLDQVITHSSRGALESYAEQENPHWVVFDWKLPSPWQGLIGESEWWLDDFPTDTFFYQDKGRQDFDSVLVLTEPGPYDGEVVYAADHLADYGGGEVTFLNPIAGSDRSKEFIESYQEELKSMCRSDARSKMIHADDWVETVTGLTEEADILVFGGLTEQTFEGFSAMEEAEEIVTKSSCSIGRVNSNLKKPHSVLDKRRTDGLPDIMDEEIPVRTIDVENKEDLFRTMSESMSLGGISPDEVESVLWKRESEKDTYLENGIALPHGISGQIDRTYPMLFVLDHPIIYNDKGDSAQICFGIMGPPQERNMHLEIIKTFAEIATNYDLSDRLLNSDSPQDTFHELLGEFRDSAPRFEEP